MLLTTHHFLSQDIYSFTTYGKTWIDPEWLGELIYYFGFHALGERGLFLVMLVAFELIIAGVFLLCRRRSGDANAALLATMAFVLMAGVNVGFRTILFGWTCFIAEMLLLEAFTRGRDSLWLLVPLFALAGGSTFMVHGSSAWLSMCFSLHQGSSKAHGAASPPMRWTPQQRHKLIAVGVCSAAALFVNPYGWRLVAYPSELIFRQQSMVSDVQEWASLDFHSFIGKFCFLLVVGLVIFTITRRPTWRLHEFVFALAGLYDACAHMRFLFLAGIVVSPLVAVALSGVILAPC